jgi:hypothetical protein
MPKRTLSIIIGSLAILLVSIVAVLALSWPASSLQVTVSFVGYTNDTKGVRLATFAVTNQSSATIRRWGTYHPESQHQPGLRLAFGFGPNVFLAPGQSEIITVPMATNLGKWRGVFYCSQDGWRLRFSDWCGRGSGGLLHKVPDRLRAVPSQAVGSNWVEP